MRKNSIILLLVLAVLAMRESAAQPKEPAMFLNELVERLVSENYGIELLRMDQEKAENNVTNAQFLPSITGSASQRQNINGAIGPLPDDAERWGTVNTLGAGVSMSWTLFDGLGMFATHDRQKKLLTVSELELRSGIERQVAEVGNYYYQIISLVNKVAVARELIEFSQQRYEEVLLKWSLESAAGLEVTLAKTDLNADSSSLIRQLEELDIAYINLNSKLNLDYNMRGYINDTIIPRKKLGKEDLLAELMENNTDLLLARNGIEIADIDVRLARAAKFPTLGFGGGYNYSATDQNNFRGTFANSNGFNWGFNMSVNIFEGLEAKRKLNNARIDQARSKVNESNVENLVLNSFNSLYANYANNLQLIDFETENSEASRKNLEIAMLRWRLGDMSGLDFRNIQQQYLAAVDRKLNVIYQAKVSEIALLMLAGRIVETIYYETPE